MAARISSDLVRRLTFGVTVTARGRAAGIVPLSNPAGLEGSYDYVAAEPSQAAFTPSAHSTVALSSFEFDCLVFPAIVKRGSPDLVRRLMLGAAKTE
jgi:hypothetical protein